MCLLDLSLYTPLNLEINLAKIHLVSDQHLKEISQILEHIVKILEIPFKCRGDFMYFYIPTRSVNLALISVTLSSQRFPLVKELKNILIRLFEFVYYQHAIHSVKLTKIVGVKSSRCNLVLAPPTKTYFLRPCVVITMIQASVTGQCLILLQILICQQILLYLYVTIINYHIIFICDYHNNHHIFKIELMVLWTTH